MSVSQLSRNAHAPQGAWPENEVISHVVAIVVRVLGLAAATWLAFWGGNLGYEGVGANIGAGILGFIALILLSLVWSFVDGRRSGRRGQTIGRWLVVGAVMGVLAAFQAQSFSWGEHGIDTDVLLSDLRGLTPFTVGLVAVPALIGTLVGGATRRDPS